MRDPFGEQNVAAPRAVDQAKTVLGVAVNRSDQVLLGIVRADNLQAEGAAALGVKQRFQVVYPVLPMDLLGIYVLLPD